MPDLLAPAIPACWPLCPCCPGEFVFHAYADGTRHYECEDCGAIIEEP